MSSLLSFGMPPSKKEKQYANTRARRHSGEVIGSQSKKSKKDKDKDKDKDTDSESVTTSSSSDTIVVPPPKKQCPLRALYTVMMEPEGKEGKGGCPFRRVQLWHTIPLCILAIVIPLLVGLTVLISLLGLAGYKISMGAQGTVVRLMKANPTLKPYAESFTESDGGATLVAEEKH